MSRRCSTRRRSHQPNSKAVARAGQKKLGTVPAAPSRSKVNVGLYPNGPNGATAFSDLFGPPTDNSPFGLRIEMATPCLNCTDTSATISPGKGPHKASLRCSSCMRFRGWMSIEDFNRFCVRTATTDSGGDEAVQNPKQET